MKKGFEGKKWGVFYHFLGGNDAAAWNERVKKADTDLWADQLAELGADFIGIPIMQCCKTMIAPNDTYNTITGYKNGEACSERDFIYDLSESLRKKDIALMLYYTCDGPLRDPVAAKAFDCPVQPVYENGEWNECDVSDKFIEKWCAVLREYSERYAERVFAWWLDGAFDGGPVDLFGPTSAPMYRYGRDEKLKFFKQAALSGNPNAVITFNGGVRKRISRFSSLEDYTAGEMWEAYDIPDAPLLNGVQWFEFLCGWYWYNGEKPDSGMKLTPEFLLEYTQKIVDIGGVVMYDVNFVDDRYIDAEQYKILSALKNLRK